MLIRNASPRPVSRPEAHPQHIARSPCPPTSLDFSKTHRDSTSQEIIRFAETVNICSVSTTRDGSVHQRHWTSSKRTVKQHHTKSSVTQTSSISALFRHQRNRFQSTNGSVQKQSKHPQRTKSSVAHSSFISQISVRTQSLQLPVAFNVYPHWRILISCIYAHR